MAECGSTTKRQRASRRYLLALGAAACAVAELAPAWALAVEITKNTPLPIAVPDFVGASPADTEVARAATKIVADDLKRSGLFAPLDPAVYAATVTNPDAVPQFEYWRSVGAQALVTGRLGRTIDDRLKIEFRLWDVVAGHQLVGQQFHTTTGSWRRVAHIISDALHERLTGKKSNFENEAND